MTAVSAVVVMAVLLALCYWILAPGHIRAGGLWPSRDRAVDAAAAGTTGSRGFLLVALAAGTAIDVVMLPGGFSMAVVLGGIGVAILYRLWPRRVGGGLGVVGTTAAVIAVFQSTCTDPAALRGAVVMTLTICGLAMFLLIHFTVRGLATRWLTSGADLALAAFGVTALGTVVGGPFGLELGSLVGLGPTFAAAVGLYFLICAAAAALPAFTNSVIGVTLLAAQVTLDTIVGDPCDQRRWTVLGVVAGFVVVWWVSGRVSRRSGGRR